MDDVAFVPMQAPGAAIARGRAIVGQPDLFHQPQIVVGLVCGTRPCHRRAIILVLCAPRQQLRPLSDEPRPRRDPERRARPARLSRARRHGRRARLGRRRAAGAAPIARGRLGGGAAANRRGRRQPAAPVGGAARRAADRRAAPPPRRMDRGLLSLAAGRRTAHGAAVLLGAGRLTPADRVPADRPCRPNA